MKYVSYVCAILALSTTAHGQQPDPHAQILVQLRVVKVSLTKLQHMGVDLAKLIGTSDAKRNTDLASGGERRSSVVDDGSEAQRLIEALVADKLAKVVAEPRLVVLNGRTANYNSGAKVAIPKPQKDGSTAIRYVYGTEMEVTPVAVGDKVHLAIHFQVCEFDDSHPVTIGKDTLPGIQGRAFTIDHTELKSGQTLVISGFPPQVRMEAENRSVPYLSEIPYVGAMFGHVEEHRNEIVMFALVRAEVQQPPVQGEQAAAKPERDVVPK